MSDEQEARKRSLSEISHLFLSGVRDRHTLGVPRPRRVPPQRPPVSIDLTPEEFATAYVAPGGGAAAHAPGITAVLAEHMNGAQLDRVRQYCRYLATQLGRVGLIELDSAEFRLVCFDPSGAARQETEGAAAEDTYDVRQMSDALSELNVDVNHWVLLATSPRTPEARALLRRVDQWVLLSTCDHDGIVASYRCLKGICDSAERPQIKLAVLDARSDVEATRVADKLSGVCQQFLNFRLESQRRVEDAAAVAEHVVMRCGSTHDKAQLATAPQWNIVGQFLDQARAAGAERQAAVRDPIDPAEEAALKLDLPGASQFDAPQPIERELVSDVVVPPHPRNPSAEPVPTVTQSYPRAAAEPGGGVVAKEPKMIDVIELPEGVADAEAVLSAILRQPDSGLIECPIRPPACPVARLAVTREHAIVLLAAAETGLGNLRGVSQAYRWLVENRALIAMALPQLNIDIHLAPSLRLIVDQTDLSADLLSPLLQSSNVSVQSFRRLRWGGKTGLFLEAA